jgi:enoyl-CoA hydratase
MLPDHAENRAYAGGKMLAAKDDGVGLITFNQPEKRNAISMEMWTGLGDILDEFAEDHSVSVVILTGAGNKAFVSGADISQFEKNRNSADAQAEYDRANGVGRNKLINFKKPVVARIRGFCMGGGLAIAMATDLRIASLDSQFGIPAARLSIAYAPDAVKRLIDLVGPAHARMILYTAKRIDAAEAERIGLINKMTTEEGLNDVVLDIARSIADNAPLSVAASKLTINEMLKDEGAEVHRSLRLGTYLHAYYVRTAGGASPDMVGNMKKIFAVAAVISALATQTRTLIGTVCPCRKSGHSEVLFRIGAYADDNGGSLLFLP